MRKPRSFFLPQVTCLLTFLSCLGNGGPLFSQEPPPANPVVFLDMSTGPVFGEAGGVAGTGMLSVQVGKVLISARYLESFSVGLRPVYLSPFTPVPIIYSKHSMTEGALLAGPRWIFHHSGLSVQTGISTNEFTESYTENNVVTRSRHRYAGVPFEIRYLWFNGQKKRYRFYQLLPLTRKPVAFGNSIGFSLSGNIAQHTYAGLGLTLGFGFYKKY